MPSARRSSCRSSRLFGLLLACLTPLGSNALASDHIVMRATCGGSVITNGEGELPGYSDFVSLSSVHHELDIEVDPPGPLRRSPIRVVKPVSVSSVRLLQRMAQSQPCEEVLIVHLQQDGQGGALSAYWELLLESASVNARKLWDTEGATLVQDAISFTPDVVTWTFRDAGGGETTFGWNFATNEPSERPQD